MNYRNISVGLTIIIGISCNSGNLRSEQAPSSEVIVVGAMKNVMWKGELGASIDLDTLQPQKGLYGLGPVEYLAGELLITDGRAFRSTVLTDSTLQVVETYQSKAPFFVYGNADEWVEEILPDTIQTIPQLEKYMDQKTDQRQRPFVFKLAGPIENAQIHIQNLPKGTAVSSPEEAHQGQTNYELDEEAVEIVGFFSTEHQGIFTHHDTFLHMHLITTDQTKMGHLDQITFGKGDIKLFLPKA